MAATLVTKIAKDAAGTPIPFPMGFLNRAGDGSSLAALHALVSAAGALINPATAEGVAAIVTALGTAIRLLANAPEIIPVVAGVAVKALSASGSAAVVRATPLKTRS